MHTELENIRRQCIQASGHTTQSLGSGRIIGQIFAHIYLSREPQSLDDLTRELGVSKGSASTTVRQLEQWGAVKKIWIKGDRKDYYEALDDFGRIARKALLENIKERMEAADHFLEELHDALKGLEENQDIPKDELKFCKQRVRTLKTFRDRARYIWDHWIGRFFVKKGP